MLLNVWTRLRLRAGKGRVIGLRCRKGHCSQYQSICNKEAAAELRRKIVRRHDRVRKLSNK